MRAISEDREVFRGRLIRVRVDPRGYELVEHPPAVVIAAVDVDAAGEYRAWLVRVRRPATGGSLVEAPAGLVEDGEAPQQAARRELREECGLEADRWEELGSSWSSPGFTDERIHLLPRHRAASGRRGGPRRCARRRDRGATAGAPHRGAGAGRGEHAQPHRAAACCPKAQWPLPLAGEVLTRISIAWNLITRYPRLSRQAVRRSLMKTT